jgi:hypothetical protein
MALVDFEQQAVLALEMVGDAAGVGARFQRDVADRYRVESFGRKQGFGGAEDGFPHVWVARHSVCLPPLDLYSCTNHKVQSTNIWARLEGGTAALRYVVIEVPTIGAAVTRAGCAAR